MRYIYSLIALLCGVVMLVDCGDNDIPVDSKPPVMTGKWILNGEMIDYKLMPNPPKDTLIYNADRSGHFGPEDDPGWFDFTYRVKRDSLFHIHSAGLSAGIVDTLTYTISADTLFLTRWTANKTVYIQSWLTL